MAAYSITLPEGTAVKWRLGMASTVELSVAALDEDAPLPGKKKEPDKSKKDKSKKDRASPDFTIELVTSDGVTATAPVSRFAAIPPPLKERFTKLDVMESRAYEKDWEPVFQTVRAPLSAFQTAGAGRFDPSRLTVVRLKFDRTPMSVICVSSVGFGRLE
jgi:hypothetical protein